MAVFEKTMTDFYETLLQLRYPGIVQVTPSDIEGTILSKGNRMFLLNWLLTQTPIVPSEEFVANTDEAKLVKWYSNMGVCGNADVLMGKAPMQDQLPTLGNLLLFMKNVLIADQSDSYEEAPVMNTLKKHMGETVNIIPSTCSLTSKLNYNEAMQYLKTRRRSLSEKRSSGKGVHSALHKAQSIAEIFDTPADPSTNTQKTDQVKVVEKFLEAFESISTWTQVKPDESTTALWELMNAIIEKLYTDTTKLKEMFHSKEEISNFEITGNVQKHELPLDEVIEDIVVLLEEVNNLHKE